MRQPDPPPVVSDAKLKVVVEWIYRQLTRIASEGATAHYLIFSELNSEPERPQNGQVVRADGTNWNPGSGAGLYERKAGSWVKL